MFKFIDSILDKLARRITNKALINTVLERPQGGQILAMAISNPLRTKVNYLLKQWGVELKQLPDGVPMPNDEKCRDFVERFEIPISLDVGFIAQQLFYDIMDAKPECAIRLYIRKEIDVINVPTYDDKEIFELSRKAIKEGKDGPTYTKHFISNENGTDTFVNPPTKKFVAYMLAAWSKENFATTQERTKAPSTKIDIGKYLGNLL